MKSIAFVTTSKGRLHHIKQTLPLFVAQGVNEVIIVDYGCPDQTGDWVEANFPNAKAVRVTDDQGFCLARARNLGARHANSEWLVLIDGDIKTAPGWGTWMQQHLQSGHFYRAAPILEKRDPETFGTVICARSDFDAVDGYDEVHRGWGGDDTELYERLKRHGVVEQDYPSEFVTAISHGDEERAGWAGMQSKVQQFTVNKCYRTAKALAAKLAGGSGDLPFEVRVKLMEHTRKELMNWFAEGASKPLAIRYVLHRTSPHWLSASNTMRTELTFTIHVQSHLRR